MNKLDTNSIIFKCSLENRICEIGLDKVNFGKKSLCLFGTLLGQFLLNLLDFI